MSSLSRNFYSMHRLSRLSLCSLMRLFSSNSLMERGLSGLYMKVSSLKEGGWPRREEGFAAARLLRQNQHGRGSYLGKLDDATFRSVSKSAFSERGNIMSQAQTAVNRPQQEQPLRMDEIYFKNRDQVKETASAELEVPEPQNVKALEEEDEMSNIEVSTLRETVFGPEENNDDDELQRRLADAELLKRVIDQKKEPQSHRISTKVISPYQSYVSHRNRWAEFRHGLVYGRSTF